MLKGTHALALEGDIALQDFANAKRRLAVLLDSLSKEISLEAEVDWVIADLSAASAITPRPWAWWSAFIRA